MLSLTTGGPPTIYSPRGLNGDIDALLFPIQHGMLYFVGFDLLPPFVAWSAASVSQEQREGYLNDYAARLQVWTTAETIPFPSLDDYDQTLQRKA